MWLLSHAVTGGASYYKPATTKQDCDLGKKSMLGFDRHLHTDPGQNLSKEE